ncbi:MAG: cyclic nucleotide-binding domain-containing protein, partial [Sandaracinaceae bacterium]
MSRKERIYSLRDEYNAARRKGKTSAALKALSELEKLEPEEPRWPHQRGEMLRREGDAAEAADAFERATDLYAAEGFVARAVAMAKTLLQVDPSRTEVLDRVDPSVARKAHREARPHSGELRAVGRSMVEEAPKLKPSPTASADEIRFLDIELVEEDEIMELDVSELELIEDEPPVTLSLIPDAPEPPASARLDRLALMPSFPLFSELPPSRLRRLAQGAELVELPAGATVMRKGDPADALYCIVDGRVRVEVAGLPPEQRPRLGEGDVFGESVLLEHAVRQTDVVAIDPLTALRVPRAVLDEIVEGVPMLDDLLFELLARRLLANFLGTSPLFTP